VIVNAKTNRIVHTTNNCQINSLEQRIDMKSGELIIYPRDKNNPRLANLKNKELKINLRAYPEQKESNFVPGILNPSKNRFEGWKYDEDTNNWLSTMLDV